MKYLIIGLGNPGRQYANTRHNIGWWVLDQLLPAEERFREQRLAYTAEASHRGRKLLLLKPTTYMNHSGRAVHYYVQQEKVPLERILVLTDDVSLPVGRLRLRPKGSDGGHNGLKDITEALGTSKFPRLRLGIGWDYPKGKQVDYVLAPFPAGQQPLVEQVTQTAAQAVRSFVFHGLDPTMTHYNALEVSEAGS